MNKNAGSRSITPQAERAVQKVIIVAIDCVATRIVHRHGACLNQRCGVPEYCRKQAVWAGPKGMMARCSGRHAPGYAEA